MPTPQQAAQNQSIQQAQQGVAPMDFDPDEVMKEIIQREAHVTLKEQELGQWEQKLQELEAQMQQGQQQVDGAQVQQQTQEQPVQQQQQQQEQPDISQSAQQALQGGLPVSITKKLVMTEQGPQEVNRQEKIHQPKQQAQRVQK